MLDRGVDPSPEESNVGSLKELMTYAIWNGPSEDKDRALGDLFADEPPESFDGITFESFALAINAFIEEGEGGL